MITVVERPTDRNPLGTTMVYKYNIDRVKNTVTRKCRLCLRGDWQKEGIDFFKTKPSVQFLIVGIIEFFIRQRQLTNGIFSRQILLKHSHTASLMPLCFVILRLVLIVPKKLCLVSIIFC